MAEQKLEIKYGRISENRTDKTGWGRRSGDNHSDPMIKILLLVNENIIVTIVIFIF